jgi:predicted metal-dependent hydrolase
MNQSSSLKIREIDFTFDENIPFHWNPNQVLLGNFVNMVTLAVPAFEGHCIRATRLVMPDIKDPALAREAELFCIQEAQHSKQHIDHLKVLTKAHPGLENVYIDVTKSYQNLYDSQSTEFNLAYAALVELCFGPIAKFVVENRECLFRGADPTISSFMLWHLIEEFEHRNAAFDIYNHVVGSYWFRLKTLPRALKHLVEVGMILVNGLNQHGPKSAEGILPGDVSLFHKEIPIRKRLGLAYELACTLLPFHNPNNMKQPEWVTQWFKDEEAGIDMRTYYPQHP